MSCASHETIDAGQNISYETALRQVDSLDKGGRWLSLGIKDVNELDNVSESEKILINHHLLNLIKNEELRFDQTLHQNSIDELQLKEFPAEAIAVVERAHVRVNSKLNYHDGYWVAKIDMPNSPLKVTVINDMHIDAPTNRVTVYAQLRALGKVVAPAQVGPGEYTTTPNGDTVGFHPNAIYLNGGGEELNEADGTGAWWVKHSWVLGAEGYYNWELTPQEDYGEGLWVEGELLEDGLTMKIGATKEGEGFLIQELPYLEQILLLIGLPAMLPKKLILKLVR